MKSSMSKMGISGRFEIYVEGKLAGFAVKEGGLWVVKARRGEYGVEVVGTVKAAKDAAALLAKGGVS